VARKQDKISDGKVVRLVHEFARYFKMHIPITLCIRQPLILEVQIEVRIVILVLPVSWHNSELHTCILRTWSVAEFQTVYFICSLILYLNLLKSTGHVMHQQFNIQQLYVLPTLYLCVLYLAENKQRLVPLTA
jgi:hypothetical protein